MYALCKTLPEESVSSQIRNFNFAFESFFSDLGRRAVCAWKGMLGNRP